MWVSIDGRQMHFCSPCVELEAAGHRISAASCYEKTGDLGRATNLYRAALAGPLRKVTPKEVEGMRAAFLNRLNAS